MDTNRHWKIRIFILCWTTYALIYFGRLNLSIALPDLQKTFHWSKSTLGLIGTSFFWLYGIGQLINGYLGDKLSSRIFITIGILCSGLINICFSFSKNFYIMIILWALNGYFLSMIWGPLVKILSKWFSKEERNGLSIGISTSTVGGYLLGWGFIGFVVKKYGWSYGFFIPGVVLSIYSFIWYMLIRNNPKKNHRIEKEKNKDYTLKYVLKKKRLYFIIPCAFCQGIIKESIGLWGPLLLMETKKLSLGSATKYILLLPFMNFIGITLGGFLNKKLGYKPKFTMFILLCINLVSTSIFLFIPLNMVYTLLTLGIISASIYGVNSILLSYIPLSVGKYNKSSSVAGLLDFSSYFAAGIAIYASGYIVDNFSWNGVIFIWLVLALLALIFLFIDFLLRKVKNSP
ncbi:MAG: MFS transporter [Anaeromicrobium sp.]|jgi:OPA family glycerol-3-phosphate transporter-like MFS transporter|uniref:MFS transporter n=1 Tax=Anaeromicrobium sp. TaxID=1929132 RepID=UPI0025D78608|nr:MFS transporter [Anaeromicrobium sp.]MCT4595917.1 MFS transporter [Anaeromicrobium sp.]